MKSNGLENSIQIYFINWKLYLDDLKKKAPTNSNKKLKSYSKLLMNPKHKQKNTKYTTSLKFSLHNYNLLGNETKLKVKC
jgi:hypothetical protein